MDRQTRSQTNPSGGGSSRGETPSATPLESTSSTAPEAKKPSVKAHPKPKAPSKKGGKKATQAVSFPGLGLIAFEPQQPAISTSSGLASTSAMPFKKAKKVASSASKKKKPSPKGAKGTPPKKIPEKRKMEKYIMSREARAIENAFKAAPKQANMKFRKPGNLKTGFHSFYTIDKLDPYQIAGYVGFKDIGRMNNFTMSKVMLIMGSRICEELLDTDIEWWFVFEILAHNIPDGTAARMYDSKTDLAAIYPDLGDFRSRKEDEDLNRQHHQNRHIRFAGWIYRLAEEIERYAALSEEGRAFNAAGARAMFTRANTHAPNAVVEYPNADLKNMFTPLLGPFEDLGETFMEPYNRVWYMWDYLRNTCTKPKWRTWLGDEKLFSRDKVLGRFVPVWMREVFGGDDDSNNSDGETECEDLPNKNRRPIDPTAMINYIEKVKRVDAGLEPGFTPASGDKFSEEEERLIEDFKDTVIRSRRVREVVESFSEDEEEVVLSEPDEWEDDDDDDWTG